MLFFAKFYHSRIYVYSALSNEKKTISHEKKIREATFPSHTQLLRTLLIKKLFLLRTIVRPLRLRVKYETMSRKVI